MFTDEYFRSIAKVGGVVTGAPCATAELVGMDGDGVIPRHGGSSSVFYRGNGVCAFAGRLVSLG